MSRVVSLLISLLMVAAATLLVNVLLYLPQEAWYRYRKSAVEDFERHMKVRWASFLATKATIDRLETQLRAALSRIRELRAKIEAIEAQYRETGAPSDVYRYYSNLVAEHNRLVARVRPLVAEYNALVKEYNSQVDAYNEDVRQLNALIARVPTSRWYLIPLPGRGSSKIPARSPARTLRPVSAAP